MNYLSQFFLCFLLIISEAYARQRIDSQNDVWCSSGSCSSKAQTESLNISFSPGSNWVNNVRQLNVPGGNGNGEITFVSQDESVCRVDANGKVTRVAPGNCVITVTKGVDIEFAAWSEDFSFNIGCEEQPQFNLSSPGNWSNQDTRQIHLAGQVGNGQVTWSTNDNTICSITNNGLLTQHSTGNCLVTAMKDADPENFVCGAMGNISFGTSVYNEFAVVNGRNCPAGWINPSKSVFLAAYEKRTRHPYSWGQRLVTYYKMYGKHAWVNLADGSWAYTYIGAMLSNQSPSVSYVLADWSWRNHRESAGFQGTIKSFCIR